MPQLRTVVFDVDGTLVDSERDGHRVAFNQAFAEFGLPDRWDPEAYGTLLQIAGGERRLDSYLTGHGLLVTERTALARRLHARKTEIFVQLARDGAIAPRPGVAELLDELTQRGIVLAVATTGTAAWVRPLLHRLFGAERFATIVTRQEAPLLKPDPSAYLLALERIGVEPAAAVAIEDSENGLRAATAAGLACVVVANDYTRGQDFTGAALVLDDVRSLTADRLQACSAQAAPAATHNSP